MQINLNKFFHPDLIHDNIVKSLIAFTLPLTVSILFQQLYNACDTIIVGHFLGENSLAAMGACASIFELMLVFGFGFSNGMGIVASRYYGAGQVNNLKKCVAGAMIITASISVFLIVTGQFLLMPALKLLGTPEEIIPEAYSYIWYLNIFIGVQFAYNLFSGLLRAIGNSIMPLVFLILSSVLNIILDVVMIKVFGLGVKGTAIATVIAQFISAVFCFIYILKKTPILVPERKHFRLEKNIYRNLVGQGLSMALMSAIVSSGTVILQSAINGFGTLIIAGHISSRKLFGLTNIPLFTFGIASSTFVSQNLGAGKPERIKKGVFAACASTMIWGIICTLILPFTARWLIKVISGSDNNIVLDYGGKYITFMAPFYGILGVLLVMRNSLQGLGSKFLPLISSIIELSGKILFTALIIPHAGTWGIILCEPLIWVVMAVQLVWVFVCHPKIKGKNFQEAAVRE